MNMLQRVIVASVVMIITVVYHVPIAGVVFGVTLLYGGIRKHSRGDDNA